MSQALLLQNGRHPSVSRLCDGNFRGEWGCSVGRRLLSGCGIPIPQCADCPPTGCFRSKFADQSCTSTVHRSGHRRPRSISFCFRVPFYRHLYRCYKYGSCTTPGPRVVSQCMTTLRGRVSLVLPLLSGGHGISRVRCNKKAPAFLPTLRLGRLGTRISSAFRLVRGPRGTVRYRPN